MTTWLKALYGVVVVASSVIIAKQAIKDKQEFGAALSLWGGFYWIDRIMKN